jgi:hypothetical protein
MVLEVNSIFCLLQLYVSAIFQWLCSEELYFSPLYVCMPWFTHRVILPSSTEMSSLACAHHCHRRQTTIMANYITHRSIAHTWYEAMNVPRWVDSVVGH